MVKNAVDVMGREEESIFEKYTKMVKDNIDYDVLISRHYLEKSMIDGWLILLLKPLSVKMIILLFQVQSFQKRL